MLQDVRQRDHVERAGGEVGRVQRSLNNIEAEDLPRTDAVAGLDPHYVPALFLQVLKQETVTAADVENSAGAL